MKRMIVVGLLGAGLAVGALPTPARAVSPPVVPADAIAGPGLASEAQYRRGGRGYRPVYYRSRRGSNVGTAIAAGAVLGLFGTLAAASANPFYGYGYQGYGYDYLYGSPYAYGSGYGVPYTSVSYGYGYGYPSYGYYPAARPVYGYGHGYRRAYYPRSAYGPRVHDSRSGYYPRHVYPRRVYPGRHPALVRTGYPSARAVHVRTGYAGRPAGGYPYGRPGGF